VLLLASIPSPSFNTISLGPLEIHIYGLLIGFGVFIAAALTIRRYEAMGEDGSIVESVLLWAIGLGFLGARAAYVSTHLSRFEGEWWKVIAIWEGGLALFGGLTVGTLTAVYLIRRRGGNAWKLIDAAAVGIPAAQAIGRWGNYFNQELFGTPSTLPWAVEIAPGRRPAEFAEFDVGRFALELIRTDTSFRLLGLSRNGWVSLAVVIGALVLLAIRRRVAADDAA
jgi:prolipoprotein diacylglyceryl transferase